jgi:hypothetical protein
LKIEATMVRTIWRPSSIRHDESTPRHQGVLSAARSMLTSGRGGRGPSLSSSIRHPPSTIDSNASNPLLPERRERHPSEHRCIAALESLRSRLESSRLHVASTKTILLLSCKVMEFQMKRSRLNPSHSRQISSLLQHYRHCHRRQTIRFYRRQTIRFFLPTILPITSLPAMPTSHPFLKSNTTRYYLCCLQFGRLKTFENIRSRRYSIWFLFESECYT